MKIKIERDLSYIRRKCRICGYIYDPEVGDPQHLIAKGTPFEKLPPNWRCPICKYPKSNFYAIKENC